MAAVAYMDASAKALVASYGHEQVLLFRALVAVPIIFAFIVASDARLTLPRRSLGLHFARLGLMTLAAGPGADIALRARGPQATDALNALAELVRDGFGEDRDGDPSADG